MLPVYTHGTDVSLSISKSCTVTVSRRSDLLKLPDYLRRCSGVTRLHISERAYDDVESPSSLPTLSLHLHVFSTLTHLNISGLGSHTDQFDSVAALITNLPPLPQLRELVIDLRWIAYFTAAQSRHHTGTAQFPLQSLELLGPSEADILWIDPQLPADPHDVIMIDVLTRQTFELIHTPFKEALKLLVGFRGYRTVPCITHIHLRQFQPADSLGGEFAYEDLGNEVVRVIQGHYAQIIKRHFHVTGGNGGGEFLEQALVKDNSGRTVDVDELFRVQNYIDPAYSSEERKVLNILYKDVYPLPGNRGGTSIVELLRTVDRELDTW